ncbi:glycoside hydrolase family 88 protein [Planctomonas deserti]|uniref:glycoside hydrolase family 88 protein n=1 Tax=Planctomonas deserti TaxID=2144185 RepID=UPI000D34EC63|nr:glycoside hydrolase family 88 protein [Planctomonas deserti]
MKRRFSLLSTLAVALLVPALAVSGLPAAASPAAAAPQAGPEAGSTAATETASALLAVTAVEALPSRASIVQAGRSAVDYFYTAGGGATADDGWRWAPYFMAVEALHQETGDPLYRQRLQAWGDRNAWNPEAAETPTSNPDSRAAIQVWQDSVRAGVSVNLAPSDRVMAADLSLAPSRYWWIDAMFMGLPLWPRWADRTGNAAYQVKHAQFYSFLKTQGATTVRPGCTNTGLFDPSEDLWWRDCKYVPQRDALGNKVFWARGNGWVMGAMARMLMDLPSTDPSYAEYRLMLQRMAARVAALQGSDGMWRSNLLSPSIYPAPETSATALFTYAIAYGIRTRVLDSATYLPVVTRAWNGMRATSLTSSGFLSHCQGVGEAPAAPSTTTSIAYCVGAFGLAATELAKLSGDLASDSFGRTATGGLGTADIGGTWTTAGTASSFTVNGRAARITTPAGSTRYAYLNGVTTAGSDSRAVLSFPRPTAGSVYAGLLGRRVGTADYRGRVVVGANGSVQIQVQRTGMTLRSALVPGLTYSANQKLNLRVQVTGSAPTTVRAKVWRMGSVEPTSWQVTATDATAGLQSAGAVGLYSYFSGSGSPSTVTVAVDDLSVRTP